MNEQQRINSDFDETTNFGIGVAWVIAMAFAAIALLWYGTSHAQAANTATITFSPSTTYSDGTTYPVGAVVVYDLYQGLKGGTKVRVGAFSSGGSITTGLLTGNEYCWDVVTVLKIGTAPVTLSDHSAEACKNFAGKPGIVTITVN